MTSETGAQSHTHRAENDQTEVERARAELVAALSELEDKVNIPKRIKRLRTEQPAKFRQAAAGVGAAAAGLITLVVLGIVRRSR